MSGPWWVKGSCVKPPAFTGIQPMLVASGRASVIADVKGRIAAFTPEWTAVTADDAGVALVTLFGGMMEPVLTRLDQLPQKAFVEALRIIGIDALAAEPASVQLQFTILDSATGPTLVPEGFQVAGRSTDGTGDLITFETQDDLYATTASIAQMQVQEGSFFVDVTPDPNAPAPFPPFGSSAVPGAALYFGLSDGPPQLQFSIGFQVVTPAGTPCAGLIGRRDAVADPVFADAGLGSLRRRLGRVSADHGQLRRHPESRAKRRRGSDRPARLECRCAARDGSLLRRGSSLVPAEDRPGHVRPTPDGRQCPPQRGPGRWPCRP